MSRSSEIRSQRYKAARQRQQLLQGGMEREDAVEQEMHGGGGGAQEEDDVPLILDEPLPTILHAGEGEADESSKHFNFHPFVVEALPRNAYFKRCQRLSRFQDLFDEMENMRVVDHVEPFAIVAPGSPRVASNAFCLLHRALEMKVSKRQMQVLLSGQSPARVRALGALYLRYSAPPQVLWEYLQPLFEDLSTKIQPYASSELQISLAAWTKSILDVRYCGTMLPKLPREVELEIRNKIAETEKEDETKRVGKDFMPGLVCEALYAEDGKWYLARIDELDDKPGQVWVTFLPEDEFGNQELVCAHTQLRLLPLQQQEE